MGLLSSLSLLVIPLLRRPEPPADSRDAEIAELKAKVENLERENSEALADIDRWRVLANAWQARYEQAINPVREREAAAFLAKWDGRWQTAVNPVQQAMRQNLGAAYNLQQGQAVRQCMCVPGRQGFLLRGNDA